MPPMCTVVSPSAAAAHSARLDSAAKKSPGAGCVISVSVETTRPGRASKPRVTTALLSCRLPTNASVCARCTANSAGSPLADQAAR